MKPRMKTDPFTRDDLREWLKDSEPEPARESPMPGQELQIVNYRASYVGETEEDRKYTADLDEATSITSRVDLQYDTHKPVLDVDMPVKAIESSTPGHFHLYIDKEMSWEDYELLLRTLTVVGILEPGYLHASLERKHTSVRLPWVKKLPTTLVKRPW